MPRGILYRIAKRFERLTSESGVFFRARLRGRPFSVAELWRLPRDLLQGGQPSIPGAHEKIVIVGGGVAAWTFLKSARKYQLSSLEMVPGDADFLGGKCINVGCMPSEAALTHKMRADTPFSYKDFETTRHMLKKAVEREIDSQQIPVHGGKALKVVGKKLFFDDGKEIAFDRLVLATGQKVALPPRFSKSLTLEEFWSLPKEKSLLVIADSNFAGASLASLAALKGHVTKLLLAPPLPLRHLPSVQYLLDSLVGSGVEVVEGIPEDIQEQRALVRRTDGGGWQQMSFDDFIYWGPPSIHAPEVDGRTLDVGRIDFTRASVRGRPDIYVLGDCAGFASASEAMVQSEMLAKVFAAKDPAIYDVQRLLNLPLRLHGYPLSLAMTGKPSSLLAKNWEEFDFNTLGYSAVKQSSGKLWCLFNRSTGFVDAVHICHPEAGDLINVATLLKKFPITHSAWDEIVVHPSAAEIFLTVAERLRDLVDSKRLPAPAARPKDVAGRLWISRRQVKELCLTQETVEGYTAEQLRLGRLDHHPHEYFAVLSALKTIAPDTEIKAPLVRSAKGRLVLGAARETPADDFSYEYHEETQVCFVSQGERQVEVYLVH